MKHYRDSKKLFKLIILAILLIVPIVFSYAETAQEIQNKIIQKDADIQKLEQEIAAYQNELESLGQQKTSLNSSLKQLDITKKKLNADISVTQNKIDKTNLKIESLSSDIGTKQSYINNDTEAIKIGIKQINEIEQGSLLQTLLSSNDFSVIWNDIDNTISVRDKIRENILNLKQIKGELEVTRGQTISA